MINNLLVFQKTYDFLIWIKPVIARFARVHKYGLGSEIERGTIELLKKIIEANMARDTKTERINDALVAYEVVRILIRLSKDYKVLSMAQYEYASKKLIEIGNLLGGWHKKFSTQNFQK
jgi:hypothetical protein